MQRPGPLQEVPLDQFLLPNPNLSASAVKSNKRPLSSSSPTLFSPTKRRILNVEGIFSPDKSWKGPLPYSKGSLGSPARFHDVLAGPASPARVLHFGLPKNATCDPQKRPSLSATAVDASSSRISSSTQDLAPSPELKPRAAQARGSHPTNLLEHGSNPFDGGSPVLSSRLRGVPSFIPREPLPQPDPCSIHYPGFTVFQDPHVVVFNFEDSDPSLSTVEIEVDHDSTKENILPRRKTRKVMITPSSSDPKSGDRSQDSNSFSIKKANLVNDTPKRIMMSEVNLSTTPKNATSVKKKATTPASIPQAIKRALRQSMVDEVGRGEDEIDD